ncbi:tripartite tricarboxylate transporter substrate binding protein [Alcaligenaceae bacterium]|nr:tripartite tricarboxylate transporter substrate binding protein [Alcaligenaceae bacterium]
MKKWLSRVAPALIASAMMTASGVALASEEFPSKSVRFVVPFSAGGGGDVLCRVVAQEMSKILGKQVYVENIPGASGQIGTRAVARASPDGHTIMFGSIGPMTVGPHFFDLPYDTLNDFQAVGRLSSAVGLIVVKADSPARTLEEFVALAKADPAYRTYGTSSHGGPNHLAGEMFQRAAGIELQHAPYKGDSGAMTDVMAGVLPVMFTTLGSVLTQINGGNLRALATFGDVRSRFLPDVPTLKELGYKDMQYSAWFGVYVPSGTPEERVQKLSGALKASLESPGVQEAVLAIGNDPEPSTAAELDAWTKHEYQRWGEVIRTSGIKIDGP